MLSLKFLYKGALLALLLTLVASPLLAIASAGTWSPTGDMNNARAFHTATLLHDGRVLVAGGFSIPPFPPASIFPNAEIYDPKSGTWTATGSLNVPRAAQTAVLLNNGKVLVAGGENLSGPLSSAELYDTMTGTWSLTGSMNLARTEQTMVLLPNGQVLVAGGETPTGRTNTTELYDPKTGTWTFTGSMNVERAELTLTVLYGEGQDGFGFMVLAAGGSTGAGLAGTPLASAELYNPKTGTWTPTGSMNIARADHAAVLLNREGKVLVAGGRSASLGPPAYLNSTELYDPKTGTWTLTGSMASPRGDNHDATMVLNDGTVLTTGGFSAFDTPQASAEIYDPATGTWASAGNMSTARAGHTGTLLYNGQVLVAGGLVTPPTSTNTSDLFMAR